MSRVRPGAIPTESAASAVTEPRVRLCSITPDSSATVWPGPTTGVVTRTWSVQVPVVRVDLRGALLISASLGLLVFGLDRTGVLGWQHPGTLALLAGGLVGAGFFVVSLRRSQHPFVPPHLMRNPARVAAYPAAFFAGVAMFAGMFVLTSFVQSAWDVPPVRIGLAFVPFAVGAIIVTALLPTMLLLGSGGTVVMITAGDVATAGVTDDSGVAGALVNSAQQIGAALGTAVL